MTVDIDLASRVSLPDRLTAIPSSLSLEAPHPLERLQPFATALPDLAAQGFRHIFEQSIRRL
ncbi:hypothetical protein JY452_04830, partial [Stenotrophomonas maltophilia]|nr:hypothetical protein [Stenotrophomonas maltophilia]